MASGGRVATEGRARVHSQPAGQAEQTERRNRFAVLEALGIRDFRRLWYGNAPLVVAAGGGLVALSGLVILALVPALRAAD
jgi:hypothetical protein